MPPSIETRSRPARPRRVPHPPLRPEPTCPDDQPPDAATRRDWFASMVRIRAFEDRVQELFMSGAIGGTTHLCQGQEAVSVGSIGGDARRATSRPTRTAATARRSRWA